MKGGGSGWVSWAGLIALAVVLLTSTYYLANYEPKEEIELSEAEILRQLSFKITSVVIEDSNVVVFLRNTNKIPIEGFVFRINTDGETSSEESNEIMLKFNEQANFTFEANGSVESVEAIPIARIGEELVQFEKAGRRYLVVGGVGEDIPVYVERNATREINETDTVGENPPRAFFTAVPSSGTAPLSVLFNASLSSALNRTIISYSWNFGDGSTGQGGTAAHIYQSIGIYYAQLVVVDSGGRRSAPFAVQINVREIQEETDYSDIGVIRGAWNYHEASGANWQKVQKQLDDGIKDFMVKQVGLRPEGFTYYQQSINELSVWSRQLAPYQSARVWPTFNFQGTEESRWIGSYTTYVPFVDSTGRVVQQAACLTPEMFDGLISKRFEALAQLSLEVGNMDGAIIDMELYYPRAQAGFDNYNDACYCPSCLQEFFTLRGISISNPRPSDVISRGLKTDYENFWYGKLENTARTAYNRIKTINPNFKIAAATLLRPESKTYLAIARGLGNVQDPVLEFTERFYTAGYNENEISQFYNSIRNAGVNSEIALGFWAKRFHPEQIGAHAYYGTTSGRYGIKGYWIYTGEDYFEGGHLCYPLGLYRDFIKRANEELGSWDGASSREFRPMREDFLIENPPNNCRVPLAEFVQLSSYQRHQQGAPSENELFMRKAVVYYFYANSGESISFNIENFRIGEGDKGLWALVNPQRNIISAGVINPDDLDEVRAAAQTGGVYGLYIMPGLNNRNRFNIKDKSHAGAFREATSDNFINLRRPDEPLYVYVPQGITQVSLTFKTNAGEPINVQAYKEEEQIGGLIPVGQERIEGEATHNLNLGANPSGTVLIIDYTPLIGTDYTEIRINSGAEPFIAQTRAGLLRRS